MTRPALPGDTSQWMLLAAGIVIASLPILALFIVTQRYFIRSAMGGAIKM